MCEIYLYLKETGLEIIAHLKCTVKYFIYAMQNNTTYFLICCYCNPFTLWYALLELHVCMCCSTIVVSCGCHEFGLALSVSHLSFSSSQKYHTICVILKILSQQPLTITTMTNSMHILHWVLTRLVFKYKAIAILSEMGTSIQHF